MKKGFLIPILFLPAALLAQQEDYTLTGKIGSLDSPAKIYLGYRTAKGSFIDSTNIVNGQFEFKGLIEEPVKSTLVLSYTGEGARSKASESMAVFLEKGSIRIESPDSLSNASITGSPINETYRELRKALRESDQKMEVITSSYNALPADKKKDKAFLESFMKDYIQRQKAIIEMQNGIRANFISKHPNSVVSLDALETIERFQPAYTILSSLYESLSANVKNSNNGRAFASKLDRMKVMEIGQMAIPFTQNDPDGKPISLSSFKGKYVLVDFWASWCYACRLENPNVVKAYNKYHDKGLEILSVSLDKTKEPWLKAIQKDGLPWHHVSDLKGWKNAVAVMYNIQAVPQNMLLDGTGRIIGKNLKGENLDAKLAEIFK